MQISNSHRFIFVHIPKTAGSSIENALLPYCSVHPWKGLNFQLSRLPIRQSAERVILRRHVTARWAKIKLAPEVFDSYLKFAVVRNPYDRAISHYHWLKEDPTQSRYQRAQTMSFLEFLQDYERRQRFHDERQARYITDAAGKLIVDYLIRFENLAEEFGLLMDKLGLGQQVSLPWDNASKRRGYEEHFEDPEVLALTRKIFARDFEYLGYDLDVKNRFPTSSLASIRAG
ncbi:MAG: sulfotransferase family 2 domain-containing protein [Alphaproteobacteria bacterium]